MRELEIRGATIACDQVGTGEVELVLMHGFQNDHTAWDPLVERLDRERYRVTRFDFVGCGRSSGPVSWKRCTVDEYARDLLAICDQLEIEAPTVIGHSLGGGTAIRAALLEPERFRALVLTAPISTTGLDFLPEGAFEGLVHPAPEQQRELARAAFQRQPSDEEFELLMEVIARATPEHIEGAAHSMRDFAIQHELAALKPRALLVCGDRDRHVPLKSHLATQQAIPRCGLQVYHDVGHVPWVEVPERFAEDVMRFINGVA